MKYMKSQEEHQEVKGGAVLSHTRSPWKTQEELPGVANFVHACFLPLFFIKCNKISIVAEIYQRVIRSTLRS